MSGPSETSHLQNLQFLGTHVTISSATPFKKGMHVSACSHCQCMNVCETTIQRNAYMYIYMYLVDVA